MLALVMIRLQISSGSSGDGLCCDFGQGSFEIQALFSDEDVLMMMEGDGIFADSILVELFILSPSSSRVCQNQSGSFFVDS
jgi:hypothetical protein